MCLMSSVNSHLSVHELSPSLPASPPPPPLQEVEEDVFVFDDTTYLKTEGPGAVNDVD
jgi:hypothetical protein